MIDQLLASYLTSIKASGASPLYSKSTQSWTHDVEEDQSTFSHYLLDLQTLSSTDKAKQLPLTTLQKPVVHDVFQDHTVAKGAKAIPLSGRTISAITPFADSKTELGLPAQELPTGQLPLGQLLPDQLPLRDIPAVELTSSQDPVSQLPAGPLLSGVTLESVHFKNALLADAAEHVYPELVQEMIEGNFAKRDTSKNLGPSASSMGSPPTSLLIEETSTPIDLLPLNPGAEAVKGHDPKQLIDVAVGQPRWDQSLASRVLWLVNRNVQGAELQLNPPQLGPLEVHISLDEEQASVKFTTPYSAVREALESAIPRLREMLSDSGLHLANVDVFQQNLAQQRHKNSYLFRSSSDNPGAYSGYPADELNHNVGASAKIGIGLVDYFV